MLYAGTIIIGGSGNVNVPPIVAVIGDGEMYAGCFTSGIAYS